MTVWNKLVRIDLTEKVTCGQTLVNIWGAIILGGAKSWCKSLEMKICLPHSRKSKEASMGGQSMWGKEYMKQSEITEEQNCMGACSLVKTLSKMRSYWKVSSTIAFIWVFIVIILAAVLILKSYFISAHWNIHFLLASMVAVEKSAVNLIAFRWSIFALFLWSSAVSPVMCLNAYSLDFSCL